MKEEAFNYYCISLPWVQLVMTQTPSHSSEYHIFKSHYNQTFTNNLYTSWMGSGTSMGMSNKVGLQIVCMQMHIWELCCIGDS